MPTPPVPKAFLSYTRFDDEHEEKRISNLRTRLEGAIRMHTALSIQIYQDVHELKWGAKWKSEIPKAVAGSYFFIPIVTPSYFSSKACMDELEVFLKHQAKPGCEKVILPIYWIETDYLSDQNWRDGHEMAKAISECQYTDWRDRRLEPLESIDSLRLVEAMAKHIKARLKDMGVLKPVKAVPVKLAKPKLGKAAKPASKPAKPGKRTVSSPTDPIAAQLFPSTRVTSLAENSQISSASPSGSSALDPKPRRRELVVDAAGRCQFKSIADAVKAAGADDVVLVRPGVYDQPVVIDKPITLLGDGPREEIILSVKNDYPLRFTSHFGRVANLTIRQGGGDFFGIDISSGRLELEGCDITSRGRACVAVRNGADPIVRGNRIHNGTKGGVFVYSKGQGTFENNDIFDNALAGIEVKEESDPVVRGNRIHNGKTTGLLVHTKGRGIYESNDIFSNTNSGIVVRDESDPVVRGNRIHDGKASGILVHTKGRGNYENNDIFANALAGIEVRDESDPVVRGNRIQNGRGSGVLIHTAGRGTLENNDISSNALSGIIVMRHGNPVVRGNRIHTGKQNGILVVTAGLGTFENNDIYANNSVGIEVRENGDPIARGNRIKDNAFHGVWVHSTARGTFTGNDLRGNKLGAWIIDTDCLPNVVRSDNIE